MPESDLLRTTSSQNERTITSEKLEVRRLEVFSYEGRASELHTWLTVTVTRSQQGSQEERVEKERPHDAESRKPNAGVVVCSKMGDPCLIYETTPSSPSQKFRIEIILRSLGYRSFLIHGIRVKQ
jgi:hypothetical protein